MNPSSQEFLVQKRSGCSHNFREFHPELYDPQCLGNSWEVLTEFQGIEEQRGCLIWWLDAIFLYETIKISFVLACNLVDVKPSHFPFSYSISIRKLQCQLKRLHLHILWVIFPFSHFPFYYVPAYLTRYIPRHLRLFLIRSYFFLKLRSVPLFLFMSNGWVINQKLKIHPPCLSL